MLRMGFVANHDPHEAVFCRGRALRIYIVESRFVKYYYALVLNCQVS